MENKELQILGNIEKMSKQLDAIHKATEINFMMNRKILSLLGYVFDYDNHGMIYLYPRGGKRKRIK